MREILRKLKVDRWLNLSYSLRINGVYFKIPIIRGNGHSHFRQNEPWALEVFERVLNRKNGIFLDVGANVGQTLLLVKSIYKDKQYIGFEPNPSCLDYMGQLIRKNNIQRVSVIPSAISENTSIARLEKYQDSEVDPMASIVTGFRSGNKGSIPIMTVGKSVITKYLAEYTISVIKIDVEGAELSVLKSLEHLISRDRPSIICEVLPGSNDESGERLEKQKSLAGFLRRMDYVIHQIYSDGSTIMVSGFDMETKVEDSNYLFEPREIQS